MRRSHFVADCVDIHDMQKQGLFIESESWYSDSKVLVILCGLLSLYKDNMTKI